MVKKLHHDHLWQQFPGFYFVRERVDLQALLTAASEYRMAKYTTESAGGTHDALQQVPGSTSEQDAGPSSSSRVEHAEKESSSSQTQDRLERKHRQQKSAEDGRKPKSKKSKEATTGMDD